MKPILYEYDEREFTSYGIGVLADCISCRVTEERNGIFELVMKYPVSGRLGRYIRKERIIKAKPNDTQEPQPFRIYRITTPINGVLSVYAQHITYDLGDIGVMPFSVEGVTPFEAFAYIREKAVNHVHFYISSDITTAVNFAVTEPRSIRACIGGQTGSFLELYGGELMWDKLTVHLLTERGSDRGVIIDYGKNLTRMDHDSNVSDVYTELLPYATYTDDSGNETVITLPEGTLPIASGISMKRVLIKDMTSLFGNLEIDTENLRDIATAFIAENVLGEISTSLTISYESLAQNSEYAGLEEKVSLCDTVTVRHIPLGITYKAKVTKTEYDSLTEKYTSITIGKLKEILTDNFLKLRLSSDHVIKAITKIPEEISAYIGTPVISVDPSDGNKIMVTIANRTSESMMVPFASSSDIATTAQSANSANTASNLANAPEVSFDADHKIIVKAGGKSSSGIVVPYASNSATASTADTATTAGSANTASNLANAPEVLFDENHKMVIKAGGKSSSGVIVPFAASATNATSADTATSAATATNLQNAPEVSFDESHRIIIKAGGKTSDGIVVPFATSASSADSAATAYNATTATNLSNAPEVSFDANNKIIVSAGGKSSEGITVPFATNASSATSAQTAESATTAGTATNLTDAPVLGITQNEKGINVTVGGKTSEDFTVPYARYADSANYAPVDVVNKGATLAYSTATTIATVDGTDITVTMPAASSDHKLYYTALSTLSNNKRYLVGMAYSGSTSTGNTYGGCYMLKNDLYSNYKKVVTSGSFTGFTSLSSSNSSYEKKIEETTGSTPRLIHVYGRETNEYGGIVISTSSAVPTRGSGGNSVISRAEGNAGFWGKQYLNAEAMIPPNTTYYIYTSYVSDCWYSYVELT